MEEGAFMFKRFKNAILILLAGTVGYVLRFWHEPNFSSVDYPKECDPGIM
jgi:hypothetical protein